MTRREARCRFTELLCRLVWDLRGLGYEVAFDEVTIHSPRAARLGTERVLVEDAVHIRKSFHRRGLAADLLIYKDGEYLRDGNHAVYVQLQGIWEGYDPLCVSGVRFNDPNHVSYGEGKADL
jgi:hypothetical protein